MTAETTSTRSSYKNSVEFGDVLRGIVAAKAPLRRIAEYGILDGYSLDIFDRTSPPDCVVEGRDIFELFLGNGASLEQLESRFAGRSKVKISRGNFDDASVDLEDDSYDIIHVDIANDGDVYLKAVATLIPKLTSDGLLILEGGTEARDQVPWMVNLNKKPMVPVVKYLADRADLVVTVIGSFPGFVVVRRNFQLA